MINKNELLYLMIKDKKIESRKLLEILEKNTFSKEEKKKIVKLMLNHIDYYFSAFSLFKGEILESIVYEFINDLNYNAVSKLVSFLDKSFLPKLIDVVIKTNSNSFFCLLASKLDGENLERVEDEVIQRQLPHDIYEFACKVKGANREKLGEAIIKTHSPSYIYFFARDVEGVDIEKFEQAILKTFDPEYIYYFAHLEGANIRNLENAIIELQNPYYLVFFARDFAKRGANIEKLENRIIELFNLESIGYFALYVNGAHIEKLENAIIKSKNPYYIYLFAREVYVKGANIKVLEDALIHTNTMFVYDDIGEKNISLSRCIYLFAKDLSGKGANIEKLEDAIIKTEDLDSIYQFALNVKGANVKRLKNKLRELKGDTKFQVMEYKERIKKEEEVSLPVLLNFIKINLNSSVSSSLEAISVIQENLIFLIKKMGLVSFYVQMDSVSFPLKSIILKKVEELYPEESEILQVYYEFLTTDMPLEEALNLDLEYKRMLEEKENFKIKSFGLKKN